MTQQNQTLTPREDFVLRFGEEQAKAIETACHYHAKDSFEKNPGSDPFLFAFSTCIGFECISRPEFRDEHGISVPLQELKSWSRLYMHNYDGEPDYIALLSGAYDDYVQRPERSAVEPDSSTEDVPSEAITEKDEDFSKSFEDCVHALMDARALIGKPITYDRAFYLCDQLLRDPEPTKPE